MINSVTVTNYRGESVVMGIGTPDKSGFLVSHIDGISPGQVDINTDSTAILDGSRYNSSKFPEREITIEMYYYPPTIANTSIESLRHLSYLYFPIKKKVKLEFNTDERLVWIEGYVESNEVDIFSEQETAQISIICPDPYFRTRDIGEAELSTVVSMFEFPFSNESLAEPFIEFGEILDVGQVGFFYQGDVDTGAVFKIHANKPIKTLSIRNTITDGILSVDVDKIGQITKVYEYGTPVGLKGSNGEWIMDSYGNTINGVFYKKVQSELRPITASNGEIVYANDGIPVEAEAYPGMIDGDTLIISTIRGNKYAYLIREGIKHNVLNAIERTNNWANIVPGYNTFEYTSDKPDDIEISITYPILYSGV